MKNTYIFFSVILSVIVVCIIASYYYSSSLLSFSQKCIQPLVFYSDDNQVVDFQYKKFPQESPITLRFKSTISMDMLNSVSNASYSVVVDKFSAHWYKLYFNGNMIGYAGNEKNSRANLWNTLNIFNIPPEIIHKSNTLEIVVYASYVMGGKTNSVFITSTDMAIKIKTWFDFISSYIFLIAQGFLISSFIIYILSKLVAPVGQTNEYLFSALSMLFIAIYAIEYIPFRTFFIPLFLTWKITQTSLFLGAICINISLYYHFKQRVTLFFAILILGSLLVLHLFFSKNMLTFFNICDLMYLLIITSIASWFYISIRFYKRSDYAKTLFFTTLILISCTVFDIVHIFLHKKPPIQLSIFGIVTLSITLSFLMAAEYIKTLQKLSRTKARAKTFYKKSVLDSMTGLFNHDYILKSMNKLETFYSFILIDIDDFKNINDRYGHPAGDKVIKYVAESIKQCTRANDIPGRYGGDEFAVLLRECTGEKAVDVANKIKEQIQQLDKQGFDDDFHLSLSMGVAESTINTTNHDDVIKAADKALYEVKTKGKNGILFYSSDGVYSTD